jgi:hypothetical protein
VKKFTKFIGMDVHVRPESRLSFCFTGKGMA